MLNILSIKSKYIFSKNGSHRLKGKYLMFQMNSLSSNVSRFVAIPENTSLRNYNCDFLAHIPIPSET